MRWAIGPLGRWSSASRRAGSRRLHVSYVVTTAPEGLLPHQRESSLVTAAELRSVRDWLAATGASAGPQGASSARSALIAPGLPFSFAYGVERSAALLQGWAHEEAVDELAGRVIHRHRWIDPGGVLSCTWEVTLFDAHPAAEWLVTFQNHGESDSLQLTDLLALDVQLPQSGRGGQFTVHGAAGGRSRPDDMMPFSTPIQVGTLLELGGDPDLGDWEQALMDYLSSNRHLPFFNVEAPGDRGVVVGIGWSGNWRATAAASENGLALRMGLAEFDLHLHPGESVRSPRVLILPWEGKPLHGQNMFRHLIHEEYVPRMGGAPQEPRVSINVCFTHHGKGGFLQQATGRDVTSLVAPAADLGAELLIIDAGWYPSLQTWMENIGDWRIDSARYPLGFRPIANALRALGAELGVWFGPESVQAGTPVALEHPDWVQAGSLQVHIPEAREWFLDVVDGMVDKEGMGCYRQDLSSARWVDPSPDRQGFAENRSVVGMYQLWDEIVRRHPGLVMEGCCGGGRRIDLETVSRFAWHQKSDRWFDTESDQCALYGANLFLPGGLLNIPTERLDDYGLWSSFAGQLCLGWHPLDAGFPMEQARAQVERYKLIRPLLAGDFYPLTPCSLDAPWIGLQFHRPDRNRGAVMVYRRGEPGSAGPGPTGGRLNCQLRGLEPDTRYTYRSIRGGAEAGASGAELAAGLAVEVAEAPGAEMIVYGLTTTST